MIDSENSVAAAELAPSAPALDERAAAPADDDVFDADIDDTLPPFRPAPQPTGAWKRRWALGIGGWGAGRNGGSVSSLSASKTSSSAGAAARSSSAGALGASSAAATLFSLSIIQSPRRLRSAPVPASPPTPE